MKKILYLLSLVLGWFLAAAGTMSGQSTALSTAVGDGADTYLSNDSDHGPDAVHGADATLNVRHHTAPRMRVTMLRFDVSDVSSDFFNDEATLSLDFDSASNTRTWQVYYLSDATFAGWDEATTTFNNAPGISGENFGDLVIDENVWSSLGTWGVTNDNIVQTSDPVSLNLEPALTNHADGLVSFLLSYEGTDNVSWWTHSKESIDGMAPTLNMVPEPSTYATILGAAVLFGAIWGRRRMKMNR